MHACKCTVQRVCHTCQMLTKHSLAPLGRVTNIFKWHPPSVRRYEIWIFYWTLICNTLPLGAMSQMHPRWFLKRWRKDAQRWEQKLKILANYHGSEVFFFCYFNDALVHVSWLANRELPFLAPRPARDDISAGARVWHFDKRLIGASDIYVMCRLVCAVKK